jgi:thiamine biosynthesis protein ThiI
MVKKTILVRYGEIALKSEPVRRQYEKRLKDNIKAGLKVAKIKDARIERTRGRLFIHVPVKKTEPAFKILERTFGVVSFSPAWHLESAEPKKIQAFVKKNYKDWVPRGKTFAVRARRSGSQREKYTSMRLAKMVGDVVNRKVNLGKPDVTIFVEVRDNESYIYTEVLSGPGGLPVSTAGKVVVLLSGGIDSAAAAWLMMKRGCQVVALYADNYPYVRSKTKDVRRTKEIVKVLQNWSAGWNIPLCSFDHGANLKRFLETKRKDVPKKFVCLLCKRMMYRVANGLAHEWDAKAVVTGETLGEVASQTLDNLRVLDEASELPVFRPLIGNDKQENVDLAKKIGTYSVSISAGGKCGAVPDAPRTRGKIEELKIIESKLPMEKLLKESVKSIKKLAV